LAGLSWRRSGEEEIDIPLRGSPTGMACGAAVTGRIFVAQMPPAVLSWRGDHETGCSSMTETISQRVPRDHWLIQFRRHPSALLLLAQLLCIPLYPLVEDMHAARMLLGIFGVVILLLALRMIRYTSARIWPGVCLAVLAVLASGFYLGGGHDELRAWHAGLEALFYFYAASRLIAYMLADRRATSDELFAAGATFTLLVWAFAYLLVLCVALQPASVSTGTASPANWSDLMFLSFVMLSCTGIGDVVPVGGMAKAVSDLEMFTGVMYVALVVSRLIGLSVAQDKR
jgi:hypothetical protein